MWRQWFRLYVGTPAASNGLFSCRHEFQPCCIAAEIVQRVRSQKPCTPIHRTQASALADLCGRGLPWRAGPGRDWPGVRRCVSARSIPMAVRSKRRTPFRPTTQAHQHALQQGCGIGAAAMALLCTKGISRTSAYRHRLPGARVTRSSTSVGRTWMLTMSGICPRPSLPRVRGRRVLWPWRRQAMSWRRGLSGWMP